MTLVEALRILGPEKAAGDREEAGETVRAKVVQFVRARGRYPGAVQDADDAVSRVFLRVLQRPRPFLGESEGEAAAYLKKAVTSDFRDQLRRKQIRTREHKFDPAPTAPGEGGNDDEPAGPILVDPDSGEDVASAREEVDRIWRILFDGILPAIDARSPQSRSSEAFGQMLRVRRGETTVEEIARAEGGDFVKARNRYYQNVKRTLKRIAEEIEKRPPEERELLRWLVKKSKPRSRR